MNKGFTLIEMIAVVLIISLIALVSVPTITSKLADKKNDINDTTLNMIGQAAELYLDNHNSTSENVCIRLDLLVSEGYLSKPIKNFENGSEIPLTSYVKMTRSYSDYNNPTIIFMDDDNLDQECPEKIKSN